MLTLKNKWLSAILAALIIFGALAATHTPASAADETTNVVYCNQAPCQVLNSTVKAQFESNVSFWGLYLSYGNTEYVYQSTYDFAENPSDWWPNSTNVLLPSEVHIPLDSNISIPEMGIFWHQGVLLIREPGYLLRGEVATALPGTKGYTSISQAAIITPDWRHPELTTSFGWDGRVMQTWEFVPEITDTELVLHIYMLDYGVISPAQIPVASNIQFSNISMMTWVPGERLEVLDSYIGVNKVKSNYSVTWEDVSWLYEDEIKVLMENESMTQTEAEDYVKKANSAELSELLGTFPNYKNTEWKAAFAWTSGYKMQRATGEQFILAEDQLMFERLCGNNECSGGGAKVGQVMYLDGSTFTMWSDKYPELNSLWTLSVPIMQSLHSEDYDLIKMREANNELIKVNGVISAPYEIDLNNDGRNENLIGFKADKDQNYDKPYIDLYAGYTPPMGTRVTVYIYKETATAKYLDLAWGVMAVTDPYLNHTWFFNQDAEYGFQYSTLRYEAHMCGGLMTIDNWTNGCQNNSK